MEAAKKPFVWPEGTYLAMAEWGHCKVCSRWQDLRCGACFTCSNKVDGRKIEGGHELWERANPNNKWRVQAS